MTRAIAFAAAAFSLAPGFIVLLASLTAGTSLSFPPQGLSLRWYWTLFQGHEYLAALWTSATLALFATTLAILLAVPAAFAIVRNRFPGAALVEAALLSPLAVPHLILGISILQLYSFFGIRSNMVSLLLGHLVLIVPFSLRMIVGALSGLDRRIEQAAASLGAGPFTVLASVVFPQIRVALIGAFAAGFILSFDEVSLTIFLVQPGYITVPAMLFAAVENDPRPTIHAASVVLLLASWVAIFVIDKIVGLEKFMLPGRRASGAD
jgi:putative spermidine/putrescine transport system permease protein